MSEELDQETRPSVKPPGRKNLPPMYTVDILVYLRFETRNLERLLIGANTEETRRGLRKLRRSYAAVISIYALATFVLGGFIYGLLLRLSEIGVFEFIRQFLTRGPLQKTIALLSLLAISGGLYFLRKKYRVTFAISEVATGV